jgi:hypothetical protein
MVRHKSRWLLVAVESEENVKNLVSPTISNNTTTTTNINRIGKEAPLLLADKNGLFHSIRITMQDAFGIAVAGIIEDIQGGFAFTHIDSYLSLLIFNAFFNANKLHVHDHQYTMQLQHLFTHYINISYEN